MTKKIVSINVLVLLLFVVDRILKIIFINLPDKEVFILNNFLKLKLATNSGISFGWPVNFYLLIVLYIIILVVLVGWLVRMYGQKNIYNIGAISLIMVGAFSNLLDRWQFRQVIDYIDLKYYSVFNLADAMIVAGVVLVLIKSLKKKNNIKKTN